MMSKMRPSMCVRQESAAGFCGLRMRARRNAHLDQIVEAVVEQDLRVEHLDHVDAEEHLEHFFVQQKVDRGDRLRIGAVEIEDRLVAFAPQRAGDLVGPVAHAVVVDLVFEVAPCDCPRG